LIFQGELMPESVNIAIHKNLITAFDPETIADSTLTLQGPLRERHSSDANGMRTKRQLRELLTGKRHLLNDLEDLPVLSGSHGHLIFSPSLPIQTFSRAPIRAMNEHNDLSEGQFQQSHNPLDFQIDIETSDPNTQIAIMSFCDCPVAPVAHRLRLWRHNRWPF
jgi:hypothetical protein